MEAAVRQQETYREVKIGNTIYCVTSVFTGEKDLKKALEDLTVRHITQDTGRTEKPGV